ncbi:MAG: arginine--tRNA ligase [Candidatus Spechtbacteria bacterium RIFCSPLOWO2_12_FULL_38_22]|uniref:Arginine--tRNA ligase n=2 Tax=Patescibacteria group TaxID=1783273 RepID=A0A1G2HH07_9BACT|nr:MAG: arginine--tRNA ligase [Candidatus Curtissbacteria bacterium RIFCSPHIGHO2_12_FULL_41_17]OGZ58924.1 MAG: arginine--tRNA ligase [Candidatus Spechtbacteria bacterium RIFCSPHIGHO2_01_FULL_38_11]OGZ61550.1 MAG: arginine--tRNA ligase [Candidatus Spechtbacteria bacterium RIFCSPLOWO2_12_FULL_38_22]
MQVRNKLRQSVKNSIKILQESAKLPAGSFNKIKIERSNREGQGDYSTSIAMQVASSSGRKPKTIAKVILEQLQKDEKLLKIFSEIKVASPGFINFYFSNEYLKQQVSYILKTNNFGSVNVGRGEKLNLEFVSVNPTGELHIGHGRTAFYGDVLANILSFANFDIKREYYINNARQSAQIKELGKTALKRGTSYKSPYLDEKLKQYSSKLKNIKTASAAGYFLAGKIMQDIEKFLHEEAKIKFDIWKEEEGLYKNNLVTNTFNELQKKKLVYEKEGATWLRTTKYGDSQDQVLIRGSGESTYLMADIAYHRDKARRGFKKLINIWGADHQGHVGRLKAAMKSFKITDLDILISQLVTLKGKMRLSKRRGNVISLHDLLKEVGLDVTRYFYLTKSLDAQMEFDLELAREQSQKNPVFYIQYTHARIRSILKKVQNATDSNKFSVSKKNMNELKEYGEMKLIKELVAFPDIIEDIAHDYQVHRLTTYVHELAQIFSQFYRDFRIIEDNPSSTAFNINKGRLALAIATGLVIGKSLKLLGINAPEKM